MKLAELLSEKKSLAARLESMERDLSENVWATEEEYQRSSDEAEKMFNTYNALCERIVYLGSIISRINATTIVSGSSMTITESIVYKENLHRKINLYKNIIDYSRDYYGHGQDKCIHDMAAIRVLRDKCASELRSLENAIQSTNWTTEVIVDEMGSESDLSPIVPKVQKPSVKTPLKKSVPLTIRKEVSEDDDDSDNSALRELVKKAEEDIQRVREKEAEEEEPAMTRTQAILAQEFGVGLPQVDDPNCPIVNSKYRKEVDRIYSTTGNFIQVLTFLDGVGIKIPASAVRSYLDKYHHNSGGVAAKMHI